ncbi:MAG: monofunctional biosynthetic peptidoglycan transglycosylase [Pseudomonadota bacterium]
MADRNKQRRTTLKYWSRLGLRFLGGLFVTVHVYALLLFFAPVPGTINMATRVLQGEQLRIDWTPLEQISPHLARAVIAAEDAGFCKHHGVSGTAIREAWEDYRETGRMRGASTITQQTAKNVFLWNGGGAARKLPEAWMAMFIDYYWGKRRVMEVYLNVAEWGDGLFGAEAAARARFGKSAADLTPREAALMAAVLPSPNRYRLDPPGPYVSRQASTYQARMRVVQRDGLDACVLTPRG